MYCATTCWLRLETCTAEAEAQHKHATHGSEKGLILTDSSHDLAICTQQTSIGGSVNCRDNVGIGTEPFQFTAASCTIYQRKQTWHQSFPHFAHGTQHIAAARPARNYLHSMGGRPHF